jgi:hypothetical protein
MYFVIKEPVLLQRALARVSKRASRGLKIRLLIDTQEIKVTPTKAIKPQRKLDCPRNLSAIGGATNMAIR